MHELLKIAIHFVKTVWEQDFISMYLYTQKCVCLLYFHFDIKYAFTFTFYVITSA